MANLLNTTPWNVANTNSFSVTVPAVAAGSKLVCVSVAGMLVNALLSGVPFTERDASVQNLEVICQDIVATGGETQVDFTTNSSTQNASGVIYEFAAGTLGAFVDGAIQAGNPGTLDGDLNGFTGDVTTAGSALLFQAEGTVDATTAANRRWWGMSPLGNVTVNAHNNGAGTNKFWHQIGISDLDAAGTFHARSSLITAAAGYQAACWAYSDTSGVDTYVHEANPIKAEGSLPGTWRTQWYGTSTHVEISGYTDKTSYLPGTTVNFKVDSENVGFNVEIHRCGGYGHYYFGARRITTVSGTPAVQPAPTEDAFGAAVCAWSTTATWAIPSDATPGVYVYNMRRTDNSAFVAQGLFVVRSPTPVAARTGVIGLKTSDYTWQAYNLWGAPGDAGAGTGMSGRSLYGAGSLHAGGAGGLEKRAFAVNFDRPYGTVSHQTNTYFWDAEYALVSFLEFSGFEIDYFACADIDSAPTIPAFYSVFVSNGHDEYWTDSMRNAFEDARDAGTRLFFNSGNTSLWRVRFAGGDTNRRTLICYKDSHDQTGHDGLTKFDPVSYTGTHRDTRQIGGGVNNPNFDPENRMTGQWFIANAPQAHRVTVPEEYKTLPIWRETIVEDLTPGNSYEASLSTVGDEWDYVKAHADTPDNLVLVCHLDIALVGQAANDNGNTYTGSGTFRYGPSLYMTAAGDLVFCTGSWRWAVGLSHFRLNAFTEDASDYVLQQATLNILRDLGAIPGTVLTAAANGQALVDPGDAAGPAEYGLTSAGTLGVVLPALGSEFAGTISSVLDVTLPALGAELAGAVSASESGSGGGGVEEVGTPTGPCNLWPVRWTCDVSAVSPEVTGYAVRTATEIVHDLSGRQFGTCEVTLRPCRRDCYDGPWPGGWTEWPGGSSWPYPALIGGGWFNLSCGGCRGSCSCTSLSEVILPAPVSSITSVVVDGVTLDASAYRLYDDRILVRADGGSWPSCNDLTEPVTEPGTWEITAVYGRLVPESGALAVGELACQVVRAFRGEDCRLPKQVTHLARQGVSISFPDVSEAFAKGRTGLYWVDLFIAAENPAGLKQRSKTYSVDRALHRRPA
jgi:hypothetical protein